MKMFVWILLVPLVLVAPTSSVIAKSPPSAGTDVALVSKVILDVKRKELDKDWIAAKRGETLASGDRVRTGVNSLAVIKFKENSLVGIRDQAELTVTGNVSGRAFSKTVNLTRGAVGFNIKKQETGEEFSFR